MHIVQKSDLDLKREERENRSAYNLGQVIRSSWHDLHMKLKSIFLKIAQDFNYFYCQ